MGSQLAIVIIAFGLAGVLAGGGGCIVSYG